MVKVCVGMALVLVWYGVGIVLVRCWTGLGVLLYFFGIVKYCCGILPVWFGCVVGNVVVIEVCFGGWFWYGFCLMLVYNVGI